MIAVGAALWLVPLQAAVRPPKLQYQRLVLPNGLVVDPAPGQVDADRARRAAVSRRLEEREAGPHRLRALLRAPDVQGLEERRARAAHLDHRVGRRAGQRLHQRRHDGVLADASGPIPAARAVDGSRPHGHASHRREDVRLRARSGEGRAPHAHRESAVRAAQRAHHLPRLRRASLQVPGDRQHERPQCRDHRRRARLLQDLLRARERDAAHRRRLRHRHA